MNIADEIATVFGVVYFGEEALVMSLRWYFGGLP